jgi:hypothetical protein
LNLGISTQLVSSGLSTGDLCAPGEGEGWRDED